MNNSLINLRNSKDRQRKTGQKSITLVDILLQRAQNQSDRTAYIFLQNGETESGSLTYGELDRQAKAIASKLQNYRGERALLLYPSGLEFISVLSLAVCMLGLSPLPCILPDAIRNCLDCWRSLIMRRQSIALTTASILPDVEKRWVIRTRVSTVDSCWLRIPLQLIQASFYLNL